MDLREYVLLMGKVVINLQSLEFLLRGFLYNSEAPPHHPLTWGADLNGFRPGDVVPVNALTDYDGLGRLIDRYNVLVSSAHPEWVIDPTVVSLRDALAHGRVSATDPSNNLFLLKFDRPSGDETTVTFAQEVTLDWLKAQNQSVVAEMKKVASASGAELPH